MALHPGAAEVIAEVLILASDRVQILATTHSPDLLNHKAIRDEHLLAVTAEGGTTVAGPIEPGARSALRDRLYAAGELLSQGPMEPDRESVEQNLKQLRLFTDRVE